MFLPRVCVWLAGFACLCAGLRAEERNFWPGKVTETGSVESWTAAGPFLFDQPFDQQGRISGFRPFYVQWVTQPHEGGMTRPEIPLSPTGHQPIVEEYTILYPLFYFRNYGTTYQWSVFQLINHYGRYGGTAAQDPEDQTLAVWPLYFSRKSQEPADNYQALLPVGGTIQDFFSYRSIKFVLFPLWVQTQRHGTITTSVPWPFLSFTHGNETGFALWPLFGTRKDPAAFDRWYALWPLIYHHVQQPLPDSPAGTAPTVSAGFLPFYAMKRGPGFASENYGWPFFGYTDQTVPYRYHETRYFWPFFVQGRGDDHYHNRWGPFYTHSVVKGYDKLWAPWPLYHRAQWQDGDIQQTKTEVFFFVYNKLEQRKVSNPAAAPAYKTHLWPFVSIWDNGAGRRQVQALSVTEVFFPDNREVRATWAPFAALYRRDDHPDGVSRTSLLWNAITWERHPAQGTSEFHLGPLLAVRRDGTGRRSWRWFEVAKSSQPDKIHLAAAR